MARYHGIDWDAVERRVAALDEIKAFAAKHPERNVHYWFDGGEPRVGWNVVFRVVRRRFTAAEYIDALTRDWSKPLPVTVAA